MIIEQSCAYDDPTMYTMKEVEASKTKDEDLEIHFRLYSDNGYHGTIMCNCAVFDSLLIRLLGIEKDEPIYNSIMSQLIAEAK